MKDVLLITLKNGWATLGLVFVLAVAAYAIYLAYYHLYKYPNGKKGKSIKTKRT